MLTWLVIPTVASSLTSGHGGSSQSSFESLHCISVLGSDSVESMQVVPWLEVKIFEGGHFSFVVSSCLRLFLLQIWT